MSSAENVPDSASDHVPGHRKVVPEVRATLDAPARARDRHTDERRAGDEQSPLPRTGRWSPAALHTIWVLALLLLAAGLAVLRAVDGPTLVQQCLAAALGVVLATGLAVRSGGQARLAAALAVCVGVAAVASQWAPLLGGAAVATGVIAACLGLLATRPAVTFDAVVLEVLLALLLAGAGALAVAGFSVRVDDERLVYTVLTLSVGSAVALVYRLGGGLHGLGRRGLILAAAGTTLLLVVLVYTAALTRYGSPELVLQVRSAQDWTKDHLGGVPHPVEVLIGVPALAWGVSMRSRRRQGWWVTAFGAAATAGATTRLIDENLVPRETALAAVYSIALGLLLGYAMIRLERVLTGRGSRAEQARVHRGEPSRMQPLH